MEPASVIYNVPVVKEYNINRLPFRGTKYMGDCSGLAIWYYLNIDVNSTDLVIHITGNFHRTYPNDPHLTVEYESGGNKTSKYHMSARPDGFFYRQDMPMGQKKPRKSSKKKQKKSSKKKLKKSS